MILSFLIACVSAQCLWADCVNAQDPDLEDYPAFIVKMKFTPNVKGDCIHMFNETTICFTDEWPNNYMFDDNVVEDVVANRQVWISGCTSIMPEFWHLHDISHKQSHTDSRPYEYCNSNSPEHTKVYILDTFVDIHHKEFEGRASLGTVVVPGTSTSVHGTHVAGLIGGSRAGVNKNARLISVQVLNDNGYGSWAEILKGLDWIVRHDKGIINISIGGPRNRVVNDAIESAAKRGWKIVVAAGNDHMDACNYSPASAHSAVTVGAYGQNNRWAQFSNHGKCVDLLAPGLEIASSLPNNKYGYMSGTSMASPIVAGVWSLFPGWSADELKKGIVERRFQGLPSGTTSKSVLLRGSSFLETTNDQCEFRVQ